MIHESPFCGSRAFASEPTDRQAGRQTGRHDEATGCNSPPVSRKNPAIH